MAQYETVAIVGVGLIGGSIGLALRERKLAGEVVGIGRRAESLDVARRVGAIDRGTTDLAAGAAKADVVVVATPVDRVPQLVEQALAASPSHALVTDAGSTKQAIVAAVEAASAGRSNGPRFVGSHPIAGDHRAGPEHARADLFERRTVVVTPTATTSNECVTAATKFWQALGAKVVTMTPAEHDAGLAATSHLPHLVATALAAATPATLLPLAASGWRDTTRVAAGDPAMWQPIFATNREQVLDALVRFQQSIRQLHDAIDQGDQQQLVDLLQQAQRIKSEHDALGD